MTLRLSLATAASDHEQIQLCEHIRSLRTHETYFPKSYSLTRAQTPPPDDPSRTIIPVASSSRIHTRPWFPPQESSSYQSGGLPTLGTSFSNDEVTALGNQAEADPPANLWETRFAMRVDFLAAFAYLLGPISGA